MIAELSGRVQSVRLDAAVIGVGGLGILVRATPGTLAELRLGADARLSTSLVVREDSLTLFGFADDAERDAFEILQTVTGVGPRLALAMLAVLSPGELRLALATEDLTALMKVPGIGRKGAQRIVLELGDRLGPPVAAPGAAPAARPTDGPPAGARAVEAQVVDALVGLGWASRQAELAVAGARKAVTSDADGVDGAEPDAAQPDAAGLLRAALRGLARS